MRFIFTFLFALTLIALPGCEKGPNTGKGFSLPEGNVANGKIAFVQLACNKCHSVDGIEQLQSDDENLPSFKLGGDVVSIKSYGDLVTSIINPSHKISGGYIQGLTNLEDGSSKMQIYNDVMTVTQLVDLVTFLEKNYKIDQYNKTRYNRFGPFY